MAERAKKRREEDDDGQRSERNDESSDDNADRKQPPRGMDRGDGTGLWGRSDAKIGRRARALGKGWPAFFHRRIATTRATRRGLPKKERWTTYPLGGVFVGNRRKLRLIIKAWLDPADKDSPKTAIGVAGEIFNNKLEKFGQRGGGGDHCPGVRVDRQPTGDRLQQVFLWGASPGSARRRWRTRSQEHCLEWRTCSNYE